MPYLRLTELRTGAVREYNTAEVRLGRDPDVELTVSGEGSDVVSGQHGRFVFRVRRWWIEDTGSRNGTYVGDQRLVPGQAEAVAGGMVVRLGKTGPRIKVEAAASRALDPTMAEPPGATPPGEAAREAGAGVSSSRSVGAMAKVVLEDAQSGQRYEAKAAHIRIGRGSDCEIRPVGPDGELISRVHAEIILKSDGTIVLCDARSVNGTFLNGEYIETERELGKGDQITLGEEGPVLVVDKLSVSHGGLTTLLVRRVTEEVSQRNAARLRRIVWSFVVLLAASLSTVFMLSEKRDRDTARALDEQRRELEDQRSELEGYRGALAAQQATTDSVLWAATTEYQRLRGELGAAFESSAPAAVVDSLRQALVVADQRTQAVEAALARSQTSLTRQLAAGDSLRRQASAEVARLRAELERATESRVAAGLADSLRQAMRAAELQAAEIGAQLRAVSGVNLASVAQANQGAVGLVTVFDGLKLYDGSGFAITPSGYFVTNRHVVQPNLEDVDSVFVTMADERFMSRAEVVVVAGEGQPDLALLKIREYSGPFIQSVDWTGTRAKQGEPAALIGFPAGLGAALDQTRTVRTSMSAGIFSKVTEDVIQFDGFTVEGSSGSPVFNAKGEVVGVHRGSLRGSTGLGFAVPVSQLIPLLPPEVSTELGR
jgi:pSer/pThr/pTyr-binding forkhead associated (FHA) protein